MTVAVVTGGGRGLGRAFAQALATAGHAAAVVARSEAELGETVALIDRAFTNIERTLGQEALFVAGPAALNGA